MQKLVYQCMEKEIRVMHHQEHKKGHQAHREIPRSWCATPTVLRCHMNSCMLLSQD